MNSGERSALEILKSYLGYTLRLRISDGRVVEGEFQCMDKDMNFMLGAAVEHHGVAEGRYRFVEHHLVHFILITISLRFVGVFDFSKGDVATSRYLGLTMIPGKHIVSCHVCEPSDSV